MGEFCPQCKKTSNGAAKRLVRDSCGHEKCRMCLLLDEEKCQQCSNTKDVPQNEIKTQPTVIKFENHPGVITCNGFPKKPDELILQNGIDIKINEKTPEIVIKKPKVKRENIKKGKPVHMKRSYQSLVIPSHIVVLNDPVQYKCNICGKSFITKSHIKYHIYCAGQVKPFQCATCGKDFVIKAHLEMHMYKHTEKKPFNCEICKKSFSEKSKLKRHSLLHTNVKANVCSECGKAFHSKESLKIHNLVHRGEKPFSCRICNLKFNNTSNLNKHLISHSTEKAHMCDQCGKTFKLKWALTVHRKSHLKVRPFECSTCSRSFINNKDLQRHLLTHLDAKPYKCSICSTNFRRKDNLYRHVKNAHPGKKMDHVTCTVKQLLTKPSLNVIPVDNPNAINVIMASPACKVKTEEKKPNYRTGTVINGPLKLAFKTNTFKNNYNIQREVDLLQPITKPYNLAESVNICQKILSPHSPPLRSIVQTSQSPSTEICQKILSPFPSKPLHYETSFEHRKHAIIKNIKFKLPDNYTNLNKNNDSLKDIMCLKPVALNSVNVDNELSTNNNTYTELKKMQNSSTSVIVNQSSNMHWRRRTSQNLCSKSTEN